MSDLEDLLEGEEEDEEDLEDLLEVEYLLEGEEREEEEYSGGLGGAVEANRNVICSWLMDDEISTIGIYGMGGIGKTTLLQHIHDELLRRPDISHHVYWVTVPQDFSIYRLQNLIARHLDFDLSSEYDIRPRAKKLSEELMKKQEWILILDDLWESFELSAVGIPVPLKGCKVIFTTRSVAVCDQMDSQVIAQVMQLSKREAWTLFMEKLGHGTTLSPEVECIAVDIVRKCARFPLGIITLAGSLRGVDEQDEWKNTLKKLKESRDKGDVVFWMLRFSYDRLDDVALQQCLLYCALFPEDYIIEREELIDYLIDDGIIPKMWSREAAFDKGHAMLDRLENAGLLQRIDGGRAVKMHDLVRDMAVRICKENPSVKIKDMAIRVCNVNPYVMGMEQGGEQGKRPVKNGYSIFPRTKILGQSYSYSYSCYVSILKAKSAFVFYGDIDEENVAVDEGTTPAAATRDHTPGRYFEEISRWLMKDDGDHKEPGEDEELLGQERKTKEVAPSKSGWTLLMTNLILEMASAVFDQLGYALVGMVLAFVALLLSIAELIHMARKERMSLLPSSLRPSTTTLAPGKPVGTIVEYFGLVGAVWQCFYSTMEYAYARQKKDNPIKMCLLPFLFLSCVVISILIKKSYINKRA